MMPHPTPEVPFEEAAALAAARRDTYLLFARYFLQPPPSDANAFAGFLSELEARLRPIAPQAVAELVEDLRLNADLAELKDDYRNLLAVRSGRNLLPIESVYAAALFEGNEWKLGRLRGPPWFAVVDAYKQGGFRVRSGAPTEADHIACELEFLAHLCEREGERWTAHDLDGAVAARQQAGRFLREHPKKWVRRLRQRATDIASTTFYRVLPVLLEHWCSREVRHLSEER